MTLLVVIPCLNEEAHLQALLDTLRLDTAAANARIVIADGGSTDASLAIARKAAELDPRVVVVRNDARIQSAGINQAVRLHGADAEFLIRVDAHAAYPPHYLWRLLQAQRDANADAVTVSMRAVARRDACFQQAAACAQNSVLGAGGSLHRKGGARQWVDHGHHALIRVRSFHAIGGYDESFTHNEDAEFDTRLVASGGRILLAADILIDYFPRAAAGALARQYFKYGQGRARTAIKHKTPLKPRQWAPAVLAPVVALSLALAPFAPVALAPALAWLIGCLGYGAYLGVHARKLCACAAGVPAAIMHFAWSIGFLNELAARSKRRTRARVAS
ncbi:MAG: glycosyltransferase family 2 protein [Hyphomonadaceae bacterium]